MTNLVENLYLSFIGLSGRLSDFVKTFFEFAEISSSGSWYSLFREAVDMKGVSKVGGNVMIDFWLSSVFPPKLSCEAAVGLRMSWVWELAISSELLEGAWETLRTSLKSELLSFTGEEEPVDLKWFMRETSFLIGEDNEISSSTPKSSMKESGLSGLSGIEAVERCALELVTLSKTDSNSSICSASEGMGTTRPIAGRSLPVCCELLTNSLTAVIESIVSLLLWPWCCKLVIEDWKIFPSGSLSAKFNRVWPFSIA